MDRESQGPQSADQVPNPRVSSLGLQAQVLSYILVCVCLREHLHKYSERSLYTHVLVNM